MALITILFRKMVKNRWLVLSLLVGMVLCTALASSMQIYKQSILQRMLVKELELNHTQTGEYPSTLYVSTSVYRYDIPKRPALLDGLNSYWEEEIVNNGQWDVLEYITTRETVPFDIVPTDDTLANPDVKRQSTIMTRSNIVDHVKLIDGRMPSDQLVNGAFEALVTDEALHRLDMVLNVEFAADDNDIPGDLRVVPVGVFAETDLGDPYWEKDDLSRYAKHFIVDEKLFDEQFNKAGVAPLGASSWTAMVNYHSFTLPSANALLEVNNNITMKYSAQHFYNKISTFPAESILPIFKEREERLTSLLWSLSVPIYLLIAFYLYMVSSLLIERQRPEISLLRSRGATKWHIGALFAMESAFYALIAFAAGPFVGAFFTRILGSSSSFMNFVNRKALVVEMNQDAILYAGLAAAFAFIINYIPIFPAANYSIVDQKRNAARSKKRSWWHLFGIDFILLGLAGYGYFNFNNRMEDLVKLGVDSKDLTVDPLLFAVPSLFILGFGLLLLRIYPWMLRLIYWIGKSRWTPSFYSTLLLVGRRSIHYHALMMFLILTLGTGIFNASAARTMNENIEEQIKYRIGADIVLQQKWMSNEPPVIPGQETPRLSAEEIQYLEPPFEIYESLPGVEQATKVFVKDRANLYLNNQNVAKVKVVGLVTDEFGRTSWMKDGLLPYHFYEYLNLIAPNPYSVLISRTAADQLGIKVGDSLLISWQGRSQMPVTVYGIMDYFPSFNPNTMDNASAAETSPETEQAANVTTKIEPMLVVGHLSAIQNDLSVEPYQVWIKMKEDADRQAFYDSLSAHYLNMTSIEDMNSEINDSRNDPFRMAMNGVMSLGFILSLLISFFGFLLYWMLDMKGRTLQLGIYRAMGISFLSMLGMLVLEQILTSGAAIGIGLLAGAIGSRIFVPLFQISFDPSKIVPPFEVLFRSQDTIQIVIFTFVMLFVALFALSAYLRSMKISQAIKLGED